ncbi:MAG: hypothetical protein ACXVP0_15745 [Bacteroidia bacterium]
MVKFLITAACPVIMLCSCSHDKGNTGNGAADHWEGENVSQGKVPGDSIPHPADSAFTVQH